MKYDTRIKITRTFSKVLLLLLSINNYTYGWDCHFLLTYSALKHSAKISKQPDIPAETLEHFLIKERRGLAETLAKNEEWLHHHFLNYPVLPTELSFKNPDPMTSIQVQFLKALRVNPTMKFPLFVQYPPGLKHRITKNPIEINQVILPELLVVNNSINFSNLPLEEVAPGDLLSAMEIVTTATDEPDYGMDINLWENNSSWFGKMYGLGDQSYGNKTIIFSSQIPFHMGFYYESSIIYKLASYLKRTYVEYRIYQYLNLSRFAFSTGHPYWGYRFLGWGLHYAQDLTQPYHATLSPNDSTIRLLYVNALQSIGIQGPAQKLVQLLTNRHSSLENYEYYFLKNLIETNDQNNATLEAIADFKNDKKYPRFTHSYPREIIAKESHHFASSLDSIIKEAFPAKYVSDSDYIFYETESSVNMLKLVEGNENQELLNEKLNELLRNMGSHTRNIVEYTVSMSDE